MASHASFARIAALAGDPARVSMLHALMDGRALTATELAQAAGISAQTASSHLAQLTDAGMLRVERQGRHRYHRIASPVVAQLIETIMQVASDLEPPRTTVSTGPRDAGLRLARTCYDHFAGRFGVLLADSLVERGHVELTHDAGLLTDSGVGFLEQIGIDVAPILDRRTRRSGRVLCRPCLDWSERRPHLAGAVGAALCHRSMEAGWTRRQQGTRAVRLTREGEKTFRDAFGVVLS